MVDHLPTPSRTRKRKLKQSDVSPTTSQSRSTKKARTRGGGLRSGTVPSPVTRPAQKIAKRAGSWKAKDRNAAALTLELNLDSDLDSLFDSEHSDPPIGIIKKKRTIDKPKSSKAPVIVKHLGAIELFDSSEDETPRKTIPKRSGCVSSPKYIPTDIIDLCSDDENDGPAAGSGSKHKSGNRHMVVLSSEDDVDNTQFATATETVLAQSPNSNHTIKSISAPSTALETPAEVSLDVLQASYVAAMERWNAKPLEIRARPFTSKFGMSMYRGPAREIIFRDDLPIVDLLTPGFFARVISDITTKLNVARKRAKKKRKMNKDSNPMGIPLVPPAPAPSVVPKLSDQTTSNAILVESKTVSNSRRFMNAIRAKRDASRKTAMISNKVSPGPSISDQPAATTPDSSSPQSIPTTSDSAVQPHTTSMPPRTKPHPILEAEISQVTLSSLLETYSNCDEDDDVSLSGLDLSYPSETIVTPEGI